MAHLLLTKTMLKAVFKTLLMTLVSLLMVQTQVLANPVCSRLLSSNITPLNSELNPFITSLIEKINASSGVKTKDIRLKLANNGTEVKITAYASKISQEKMGHIEAYHERLVKPLDPNDQAAEFIPVIGLDENFNQNQGDYSGQGYGSLLYLIMGLHLFNKGELLRSDVGYGKSTQKAQKVWERLERAGLAFQKTGIIRPTEKEVTYYEFNAEGLNQTDIAYLNTFLTQRILNGE